jgi:hypothetical protein
MKTYKITEIAKVLEDGLNDTIDKHLYESSSEILRDANELAPLDKGTLRNSSVIGNNAPKRQSLFTWGVVYAKKLWYDEDINFQQPKAVNKWGEVSYKNNIEKYEKMFAKLFGKNKIK